MLFFLKLKFAPSPYKPLKSTRHFYQDYVTQSKDQDIIDRLQKHALHLKSKVNEKESAWRDKPNKSINTLYQERITFIQTYKCLKLMEICCFCCPGNKLFQNGGSLEWMIEISRKVSDCWINAEESP